MQVIWIALGNAGREVGKGEREGKNLLWLSSSCYGQLKLISAEGISANIEDVT